MTQAEHSIYVVNAIREIMSRGKLPRSTAVRAAHTEFVAALAANPPRPIYVEANSDDLTGRAEHLEKAFAAFQVYLTAVLADTAQHVPGGKIDRKYIDNLFSDVAGDSVGAIERAASEMREHEDWGAS